MEERAWDPTPFQAWLTEQKARLGSWNAVALKLGVPSSYVIRWRQGGLPEGYRLDGLATATSTDPDTLRKIMWESAMQRSAERRRRPGGDSSGYNSTRRPLAHAGHATEVLIPAGAARLRRPA